MDSSYSGRVGPHRYVPLCHKRSTKSALKHKILPDEAQSESESAPDHGDAHPDLYWDDDVDVDSENMARLTHIPEGSMRRDAMRLTRKARARLPRVTAYSTATYVCRLLTPARTKCRS